MKVCQDAMKQILTDGNRMLNKRTGHVCSNLFGLSTMFDTGEQSPMPTIKEGYFTGAKVELAWILKGLTNTDYLNKHGVKFWNQWRLVGKEPLSVEDVVYMYDRVHGSGAAASKVGDVSVYEHHALLNELEMMAGTVVSDTYDDTHGHDDVVAGDLGPVYGAMLRAFPNPDGTTTDQLETLIHGLLANQSSRRHVVSLWCPFYLPDERHSPQRNVLMGKQALAPCHFVWTFHVEEIDNEYVLNLHFNMRSNDYAVGFPVNLVFYDLLLRLVAQTVGMAKGRLWYTGTNAHIYDDQELDCKILLDREPMTLPTLVLDPMATVFNFEPEMAVLVDYKNRGKVSFKVAK